MSNTLLSYGHIHRSLSPSSQRSKTKEGRPSGHMADLHSGVPAVGDSPPPAYTAGSMSHNHMHEDLLTGEVQSFRDPNSIQRGLSPMSNDGIPGLTAYNNHNTNNTNTNGATTVHGSTQHYTTARIPSSTRDALSEEGEGERGRAYDNHTVSRHSSDYKYKPDDVMKSDSKYNNSSPNTNDIKTRVGGILQSVYHGPSSGLRESRDAADPPALESRHAPSRAWRTTRVDSSIPAPLRTPLSPIHTRFSPTELAPSAAAAVAAAAPTRVPPALSPSLTDDHNDAERIRLQARLASYRSRPASSSSAAAGARGSERVISPAAAAASPLVSPRPNLTSPRAESNRSTYMGGGSSTNKNYYNKSDEQQSHGPLPRTAPRYGAYTSTPLFPPSPALESPSYPTMSRVRATMMSPPAAEKDDSRSNAYAASLSSPARYVRNSYPERDVYQRNDSRYTSATRTRDTHTRASYIPPAPRMGAARRAHAAHPSSAHYTDEMRRYFATPLSPSPTTTVSESGPLLPPPYATRLLDDTADATRRPRRTSVSTWWGTAGASAAALAGLSRMPSLTSVSSARPSWAILRDYLQDNQKSYNSAVSGAGLLPPPASPASSRPRMWSRVGRIPPPPPPSAGSSAHAWRMFSSHGVDDGRYYRARSGDGMHGIHRTRHAQERDPYSATQHVHTSVSDGGGEEDGLLQHPPVCMTDSDHRLNSPTGSSLHSSHLFDVHASAAEEDGRERGGEEECTAGRHVMEEDESNEAVRARRQMLHQLTPPPPPTPSASDASPHASHQHQHHRNSKPHKKDKKAHSQRQTSQQFGRRSQTPTPKKAAHASSRTSSDLTYRDDHRRRRAAALWTAAAAEVQREFAALEMAEVSGAEKRERLVQAMRQALATVSPSSTRSSTTESASDAAAHSPLGQFLHTTADEWNESEEDETCAARAGSLARRRRQHRRRDTADNITKRRRRGGNAREEDTYGEKANVESDEDDREGHAHRTDDFDLSSSSSSISSRDSEEHVDQDRRKSTSDTDSEENDDDDDDHEDEDEDEDETSASRGRQLREATAKAEKMARHLVSAIREKQKMRHVVHALQTRCASATHTTDSLRAVLRATQRESRAASAEVERLHRLLQPDPHASLTPPPSETQMQRSAELDWALSELGLAHGRQREAEWGAERLRAELRSAVQHIQLLDEALTTTERRAAQERLRVWRTEQSVGSDEAEDMHDNHDNEATETEKEDVMSGVRVARALLQRYTCAPSAHTDTTSSQPHPDSYALMQSWPRAAREAVNQLVTHGESLALRRAEDARAAALQLSHMRRRYVAVQREVEHRRRALRRVRRECAALHRDKAAMRLRQRRCRRRLRAIRAAAVRVCAMVRTSREEAVAVRTAAERCIRATSSSPSSHARDGRAVKEARRVRRFTQQVMLDFHAMAQLLFALRAPMTEDSEADAETETEAMRWSDSYAALTADHRLSTRARKQRAKSSSSSSSSSSPLRGGVSRRPSGAVESDARVTRSSDTLTALAQQMRGRCAFVIDAVDAALAQRSSSHRATAAPLAHMSAPFFPHCTDNDNDNHNHNHNHNMHEDDEGCCVRRAVSVESVSQPDRLDDSEREVEIANSARVVLSTPYISQSAPAWESPSHHCSSHPHPHRNSSGFVVSTHDEDKDSSWHHRSVAHPSRASSTSSSSSSSEMSTAVPSRLARMHVRATPQLAEIDATTTATSPQHAATTTSCIFVAHPPVSASSAMFLAEAGNSGRAEHPVTQKAALDDEAVSVRATARHDAEADELPGELGTSHAHRNHVETVSDRPGPAANEGGLSVNERDVLQSAAAPLSHSPHPCSTDNKDNNDNNNETSSEHRDDAAVDAVTPTPTAEETGGTVTTPPSSSRGAPYTATPPHADTRVPHADETTTTRPRTVVLADSDDDGDSASLEEGDHEEPSLHYATAAPHTPARVASAVVSQLPPPAAASVMYSRRARDVAIVVGGGGRPVSTRGAGVERSSGDEAVEKSRGGASRAGAALGSEGVGRRPVHHTTSSAGDRSSSSSSSSVDNSNKGDQTAAALPNPSRNASSNSINISSSSSSSSSSVHRVASQVSTNQAQTSSTSVAYGRGEASVTPDRRSVSREQPPSAHVPPRAAHSLAQAAHLPQLQRSLPVTPTSSASSSLPEMSELPHSAIPPHHPFPTVDTPQAVTVQTFISNNNNNDDDDDDNNNVGQNEFSYIPGMDDAHDMTTPTAMNQQHVYPVAFSHSSDEHEYNEDDAHTTAEQRQRMRESNFAEVVIDVDETEVRLRRYAGAENDYEMESEEDSVSRVAHGPGVVVVGDAANDEVRALCDATPPLCVELQPQQQQQLQEQEQQQLSPRLHSDEPSPSEMCRSPLSSSMLSRNSEAYARSVAPVPISQPFPPNSVQPQQQSSLWNSNISTALQTQPAQQEPQQLSAAGSMDTEAALHPNLRTSTTPPLRESPRSPSPTCLPPGSATVTVLTRPHEPSPPVMVAGLAYQNSPRQRSPPAASLAVPHRLKRIPFYPGSVSRRAVGFIDVGAGVTRRSRSTSHSPPLPSSSTGRHPHAATYHNNNDNNNNNSNNKNSETLFAALSAAASRATKETAEIQMSGGGGAAAWSQVTPIEVSPLSSEHSFTNRSLEDVDEAFWRDAGVGRGDMQQVHRKLETSPPERQMRRVGEGSVESGQSPPGSQPRRSCSSTTSVGDTMTAVSTSSADRRAEVDRIIARLRTQKLQKQQK